MTGEAIRAWLDRHAGLLDELQQALVAAAAAAGDAVAVLEAGAPDPEVADAFGRAGEQAHRFLAVLDRAAAVAPISDAETARHFRRSLERWRDAAQTQREAASQGDTAAMLRVSHLLGAGTNEFLEFAAALRRATGRTTAPRGPTPPPTS